MQMLFGFIFLLFPLVILTIIAVIPDFSNKITSSQDNTNLTKLKRFFYFNGIKYLKKLLYFAIGIIFAIITTVYLTKENTDNIKINMKNEEKIKNETVSKNNEEKKYDFDKNISVNTTVDWKKISSTKKIKICKDFLLNNYKNGLLNIDLTSTTILFYADDLKETVDRLIKNNNSSTTNIESILYIGLKQLGWLKYF